MVLAVDAKGAMGTFSVSVNGVAVTGFPNPASPRNPSSDFGGLPQKTLGSAFAAGIKRQHSIVLNDGGSLAGGSAPGAPTIDVTKLKDILLVLQFHL
jgi:hypothetical protein